MRRLRRLGLSAALVLLVALPMISQSTTADVMTAPPSPDIFVYSDSALRLNTPASIVVQFDRTQLVNVTSIGKLQTARTIIIKDNVIIWNTTLPDVWQIQLEINYPLPHNQTLSVGFWSNNELVSSPLLSVTQKKIVIRLQVATVAPLVVPTPEQIANQVVSQVRDNLNSYTSVLAQSIQTLDQNNKLMWQIVTTNLAVSVFALVTVIVSLLTRRK